MEKAKNLISRVTLLDSNVQFSTKVSQGIQRNRKTWLTQRKKNKSIETVPEKNPDGRSI